jgi:hypothetical protein
MVYEVVFSELFTMTLFYNKRNKFRIDRDDGQCMLMLFSTPGTCGDAAANREVKMKFVCPVCGQEGDISEEESEYPLTKRKCRHCRAILIIDPDTGRVDAHKAGIKDQGDVGELSSGEAENVPGVLGMSANSPVYRDWPARALISLIALIALAAVVYALVHSGEITAPFRQLSEFLRQIL